jgi:hypothetical protein
MKSTKPIHYLGKILEWETVDQVLISGVCPLRKNEPDCPFNDRIDDARCYLSHLDDLKLLMMEEEGENPIECLSIPIWVLGRLFVSLEWDLCLG